MASSSEASIESITADLANNSLQEEFVVHDDVDIQEGVLNWEASIIAKVFCEDPMFVGSAERAAKRIWQDAGNFFFSYHDTNMYSLRYFLIDHFFF